MDRLRQVTGGTGELRERRDYGRDVDGDREKR